MTAPPAGGAFFGRRKGKQLRPGQEDLLRDLLPRVRLQADALRSIAAAGPSRTALAEGDPDAFQGLGCLFPKTPQRVRLEIGFGGGEHLAAQARAHPGLGFIGCEPFVNGIAKLLRVLNDEGLENVLVWDRDATELLPLLPAASVEGVFLLYPDPWPKRRQHKRRFVSDESLTAMARLLRRGGFFRFATDIDDYAGWVLARVLRSDAFRWTATRADDWRQPPPDWPGTRYEAKAMREGRPPIYLEFERM